MNRFPMSALIFSLCLSACRGHGPDITPKPDPTAAKPSETRAEGADHTPQKAADALPDVEADPAVLRTLRPIANQVARVGERNVVFTDPHELTVDLRQEPMDRGGSRYVLIVSQRGVLFDRIDFLGPHSERNYSAYRRTQELVSGKITDARLRNVLIVKGPPLNSGNLMPEWIAARYQVTDLAIDTTVGGLEDFLATRERVGKVEKCRQRIVPATVSLGGNPPAHLNLCASVPGSSDFVCVAGQPQRVQNGRVDLSAPGNFAFASKRQSGVLSANLQSDIAYQRSDLPKQLWVSIQGRGPRAKDGDYEILSGTLNVPQDCEVRATSSADTVGGEFVVYRRCVLRDESNTEVLAVQVNSLCRKIL